MTGKWLLAGGSAIFLSIGTGAYVWWRSSSQPASNPAAVAKPSTEPKPPAAFFGNEVSLSGVIQAKETILVPAPIDGTIQEVMADIGTPVFQGQVIARIRNGKLDTAHETATAEVEKLKTRQANIEGSIIAARLDAARAQGEALRAKNELERAEKNYNRQVLLYKEDATPRLIYEKSERDYKQAQADADNLTAVSKNATDRVDSLNQDLDTTKKLLEQKNQDLEAARLDVASGEVQAPADGLVIMRKGVPGEPITKAVRDFFQIAINLAALQAVVEADPTVLPRIKEGQKAAIRVGEFPENIAGVVREIKGSTVLVDFASPAQEIKPGLTAQVKIKLGDGGGKVP